MTMDARESSQNDGMPQRLFLFTMGDETFSYVNSAKSHNYNNIIYVPMQVTMDDLTQALSEDSPTIRIEIDSRSPLAALFIPYMPIIPVKVRVYRHHLYDGDYKTELIGEVANGSIDAETDNCVLSVRMLASNMDRKVPWPIYQKQCNHVLYGPGCRVDREAYKVEATVTGVSGVNVQSASFLHGDPSYFVAGYMIRVATGEIRWVIAQNDDVLTLQTPFLGLQGGETVVAFAGCDLLKVTCENKFNNLPRFWGFNNMPNRNPFTDNVFGTGSPSGSGGGGSSGGNSGNTNMGSN